MSARRAVSNAVIAGAAVTVAVVAIPWVRFAYRSYSTHIVLETAESLVALLLAYLIYGRFLVDRQRHHLVLAVTFAVLAGSDLCLAVLPAALSSTDTQAFTGWALLTARFVGAIGLLVAATLPPRRVEAATVRMVWVFGPALAILAVIAAAVGAAVAAVEPSLPAALLQPGASNTIRISANLPVAAAQTLTGVAMAVAALAFVRRAERDDDDLMTWFGAAAVLGAWARLLYALFPSMSTHWLYTGDLLRLGFYLLLLAGAIREIDNYWERSAGLAVAEERRRFARDLHDGLAQELALVATLAKRMQGYGGSHQLVSAAQRALDEARRAIAALRSNDDEPLEDAVSQAAEEVAGRTGKSVRFDLATGLQTTPATREVLLRVVREAVSNATRHADASAIHVTMQNGDGILLRIADDGCGFDVDQARQAPGRYGLLAMHERAAAVGGELRLRSAPGQGTEVEVKVP